MQAARRQLLSPKLQPDVQQQQHDAHARSVRAELPRGRGFCCMETSGLIAVFRTILTTQLSSEPRSAL